jgi:indolepyruvate ferredoxin oxidoreductase
MQTMSPPTTFTLDDRFTVEEGVVYLTGIQALVRVLIDQRRADTRRGLNTAGFVSGYPGSPLGGVDLELNRRRLLLEEHRIVNTPGLNEDLAATAVFGSQMAAYLPEPEVDGVIGMWFAKAPGVDRSGDAFRIANLRGVGPLGGVLVLAGDDPDAKSTIYPSDSNAAFYDWQMPIVFPGDVQGIVDLGLHGYGLSRASGLYVGVKMPTNVAEAAGTVEVSPDRIRPIAPAVEMDGKPFTPVVRPNQVGPPMKEAERDLVYGRIEIARAYAEANGLNRTVVDPPSARIGMIAPGQTYFDLREALDHLGLDAAALARQGIRIMKVDVLFPADHAAMRRFATGLREIVVVEEKRPFLELFLKEALYGMPDAPTVVGKTDERGQAMLPLNGELTPEVIASIVGRRLQTTLGLESIAEALAEIDRPKRKPIPLTVDRTMYFCSGCPHNRSLVVPEGSVVGAGIGCHTMALVVPREEFGTLSGITHMGGEGAQWIGAAPFSGTKHIFQNIGDGTFHHSGSLALRAAIAAKVNITYKLLYNSAVGMTGGQDVAGALAVPELVDLLTAEGVRRTIITTDDPDKYKHVHLAGKTEVRHRDDILEAQAELAATPGVTVLIHDQQCAAEKRRLRKRDKVAEPTTRILINERVCEGCGDCGQKSNCLSVQPVDTEFGRKTAIHQSSCNLDYSCLRGDCPSFLTVDTAGAKKQTRAVPIAPTDLPDPVSCVPTAAFNIHMTGIGGTGVVTTSQILATAAVLDGRTVRNLDITGSSQKAGPVVSTLQIADEGRPLSSTLLPGHADVLLAFDLLTALQPQNVEKASAGRTVVVASQSAVPTGRMVLQPGTPYPKLADMRTALDAVSRPDDSVYVDVQRLAVGLFGTHMVANSMLVGAAYQAGALPFALASIEEAIRLNGTAVDLNLAAFRWGRAAVARPDSLPEVGEVKDRAKVIARVADLVTGIDADAELHHLLEVRVNDLAEYQDLRYAAKYAAVVRSVAAAERKVSGEGQALAEAVARNLYKLMAYKDEYEVARLHLEDAAAAAVTAEFGEGVSVKWNLHPPALKALGLNRKVALGSWFRPAFSSLVKMRRLRGTPLDVFGYAEVRKIERALVTHYRRLIETAVDKLDADNRDLVVELAALPDLVRGYEEVKLGNVRAYLERVRDVTARLGLPHLIDDVLAEV